MVRKQITCTTDGTPEVEDRDALGRHAEYCLGLDDDQVGLVCVGVVRVGVIWIVWKSKTQCQCRLSQLI